MTIRWQSALCVVFLMLCVCVFFRAFFSAVGDLPVVAGGTDNILHIYPTLAHMHERQGPALWNSWIFSGLPLYSNAQMLSLYPPAILLARCFEGQTSLALLHMLHSALALGGTFLFLRTVGVSRRVAIAAALVHGGYAMATLHVYTQTFAYLPFVLWAAWRILHAPRIPWPAVGIGAVACAAIQIGGHPQIFSYSILLLVPVLIHSCLVRREHPGREYLRRWGVLAAACVLAAAIAAYQLIPIMHAGAASHRAKYSTSYFALRCLTADMVLDKPHDMGAVSNIFFPETAASYALLACFVLILATVRRGDVRLSLLCFYAVAVLYSVGDLTPFARWINSLLPMLNLFREPEKALLAAAYLLVIGGAMALDDVARQASGGVPFRAQVKRIAGFCAALAGAYGICRHGTAVVGLLAEAYRWGRGVPLPEHIPGNLALLMDAASRLFLRLMAVTAVCGAVALILFRLRWFGAASWALPVICAVVFLASPAVCRKPVEKHFPKNDLVKLLTREAAPFRALNMGTTASRIINIPVAMRYGIDLADGVEPVMPLSYYDSWLAAVPPQKVIYPSTSLPPLKYKPDELTNLDVLRKWNVRYILSANPGTRSDLTAVAEYTDLPSFVQGPGVFPKVYVYEVPGWRERCWIADADAGKGTVRDILRDNMTVTCTVDAREPLTLVNASSVPEDWQVRVDGHDATRLVHEGVMPAVRVDAGVHRVEFRVVPSTLKLSYVAISAVATLGAAGLIVSPIFRRRKDGAFSS